RRVGEAALDQLPDQGEDLGNVLGGARIVGGREQIVELRGAQEGGDVALAHRAVLDPLGPGALDDAVVHVGEVVDVGDVETQVQQVAPHQVARERGAHVPDVRL